MHHPEISDKYIQRAIDALPSWEWEEWLAQNKFVNGERYPRAISSLEWNRDWLNHGRGWRVRVAPEPATIDITVYNGILSRTPRQVAKVSVAERSVVGVVGKLIKELDRDVSDITKKRRVRAIASATPFEWREDCWFEVSCVNTGPSSQHRDFPAPSPIRTLRQPEKQ